MLIPVITYVSPDGELCYGNYPPPRCADTAEVERAVRAPLQALRGMRSVRVAVVDDVTSRPVLLFRIR